MASLRQHGQSSRTPWNWRKDLGLNLLGAFVLCSWGACSETCRCQKHLIGRAWCKRPVHGQISRKLLATARLAESSPWFSCRGEGQGSPWPLSAVVGEAQVFLAPGIFSGAGAAVAGCQLLTLRCGCLRRPQASPLSTHPPLAQFWCPFPAAGAYQLQATRILLLAAPGRSLLLGAQRQQRSAHPALA